MDDGNLFKVKSEAGNFKSYYIADQNKEQVKKDFRIKHAATEWRFLGGFADASDENYEAAANRELTEECGSVETGKMQYIGSAKIDDWRYRNEADKIITLFLIQRFCLSNR